MSNTALLIIDVQDDYFPGGKMVLPGADKAVLTTQAMLKYCREKAKDILHIQHESRGRKPPFFCRIQSGKRFTIWPNPLQLSV